MKWVATLRLAAGAALLAGLGLPGKAIAPGAAPQAIASIGAGAPAAEAVRGTPPKVAPPSPGARVERLTASGDPSDAYRAFRLIEQCVRARESDAACRGIGAAQRRDRLALLEKAARAGVPGAASAWAGAGPFGDKSALTQRPDDPLVAEWVRDAVEMIRAAAGRNDVAAITQLGWLTVHWDMGDAERLAALVSHPAEWESPAAPRRGPQGESVE